MLKIDSRKAGLVHFCRDKAPFSGKKEQRYFKEQELTILSNQK